MTRLDLSRLAMRFLFVATWFALPATPAHAWQPPPADVVLRVRYWSPMAGEDLQLRGNGAFRLETHSQGGLDAAAPPAWVEQGRLPLEDLRRLAKNLKIICKMEPYRDTAVHGQTLVALRIAPGSGCIVRFNGRGDYEKRPNAGLRALRSLLEAVHGAPRIAQDPAAPVAARVAPLADARAAQVPGPEDRLRVAWFLGGWQVGEVALTRSGALQERTVFDGGFACRPVTPATLAQFAALARAAQPSLCGADRAANKAKGLHIQLLPADLPPGCDPQPLDLPTLTADPARAALWQPLYIEILRACPLDALLFGQTLQPIALGLPPHRD